MNIAFSKNQVTKDFDTQARPVGTHEEPSMAEDMLYGRLELMKRVHSTWRSQIVENIWTGHC